MATWTDMSRNSKKHGSFAGRSKIEQDAYFEFFAGTEISLYKVIRIALAKLIDRIIQISKMRRLRLAPPRLVYSEVTNRD